MRNQEWNAALAELLPLHLAELILGLLSSDTVDGEAPLGVVDESEVLARLFNRYHVHVTGWVCCVGADLAIDLDKPLHDDGFGLSRVEGIFEAGGRARVSMGGFVLWDVHSPISNEDNQGHAVSEFVRTGRGTRSVGARELVQEPVRGRGKALLVFLPAQR